MTSNVTLSWPETLPLPTIDYPGEPRNTTIVSAWDDLIVTRRSRFAKTYAILSVVWKMTADQFSDFKDFVSDDLQNSARLFTMDLRYPKNSALSTWVVRLMDTIESAYEDGIWTVQGNLEVLFPVDL